MNFFRFRESVSGLIWGKLLGLFLAGSRGHLRIVAPLKFILLKRIFIGDNVRINAGCWLQVHNKSGELKIGTGSIIGHSNHIYAYRSIMIGENVLTADKVYITDCLHDYEDPNTPIMFQDVKALEKVIIGNNSWLGENVVILGASIGKNCVIGANSVVTKDIPDYSIAAGVPAKIIKKYNHTLKTWVKV